MDHPNATRPSGGHRLPAEWYEDKQNLLTLAFWLEHSGRLTTVAETIAFFEKPWKWTGDWNRMVDRLRAALPDDGDDVARAA